MSNLIYRYKSENNFVEIYNIQRLHKGFIFLIRLLN